MAKTKTKAVVAVPAAAGGVQTKHLIAVGVVIALVVIAAVVYWATLPEETTSPVPSTNVGAGIGGTGNYQDNSTVPAGGDDTPTTFKKIGKGICHKADGRLAYHIYANSSLDAATCRQWSLKDWANKGRTFYGYYSDTRTSTDKGRCYIYEFSPKTAARGPYYAQTGEGGCWAKV
jgi:hypothetical protein